VAAGVVLMETSTLPS